MTEPPSGGSIPPLQPATYRSSANDWELHVDPTTRDGTGAGDYELRKAAESVWKQRQAFTFLEAVVASDGRVAGFAYPDPYREGDAGTFVVALLGPDGHVLGMESMPRSYSGVYQTPPNPNAIGLVLDEPHRRFIVLVADDERDRDWEEWRVYDLLDGSLKQTFRPCELAQQPEDEDARLWYVRPVSGVPLYVAFSWVQHDEQWSTRHDARIALIDLEGRTVWRRDLAGDLDHGELGDWFALRDRIASQGGPVFVQGSARFEVWSLKSRERIAFAVRERAAAKAWSVEETGRAPFDPPEPPPPAEPVVEPIELRSLGAVDLRADPVSQASPVRDIVKLGFDATGHAMVLRREVELGRWTCLLLDASGNVLVEHSFGPIETKLSGSTDWWPFEDGRWLVVHSPYDKETVSQLWWADPATGALDAIEDLGLPAIEAVASTKDGGFVAILDYDFGVTSTPGLASVDGSGKLRWENTYGSGGQDPEAELLSPQDVAVAKDGRICVVSCVEKELHVYEQNGDWSEAVDLTTALENEQPYLVRIVVENSGDVLVHDFGTPSARLVRVDRGGAAKARIEPHRADGFTSRDLAMNFALAPDGRIWTHDGHVVMRLDEQGLVDLVLGNEAAQGSLTEPSGSFMDSRGRIVVTDERTRSFHCFDVSGQRLVFGAVRPEDGEPMWGFKVAVGGDGSIYLRGGGPGALKFSSEGERLGCVDLGGRAAVFVSGTETRWVEVGYGELGLIGPDGELVRRLDRLPDRQWFTETPKFTVASDGALIALDTATFSRRTTNRLAWWSADGTPEGDVVVPSSTAFQMAASDEWIAIEGWSCMFLLVRRNDGALFQFRGPEAPPQDGSAPRVRSSGWDLGFSPDGAELWLVQRRPLRLHRFALPDQGK